MKETLLKWNCHPIKPIEMYSNIFKLGEGLIQTRNEPPGYFKTNPLIIGYDGVRVHTRILFEDEFESLLAEFQEYDWAFIGGLTYWGRENIGSNQSKAYALIFDLDGVTAKTLNTFLDGAFCGYYPLPNYIVLSGHGVHLYYVFEHPLPLFPEKKRQLKELKHELTTLIWNERTSTDRNRQYQGINQAYRIPGGKTKIEGVRAEAFEVNRHPVSVEYLNEFVDEQYRVDLSKMFKESTVTLEEAAQLWPDWYKRRVLNNEPPGTWTVNRKLYDWWKTKIFDSATVGHRYYCVMALAIFAVKCGIEESELREDAYSFVNMLNSLNPEESFLDSDVNSALDCYDERYKTFPRADLERLTGIPMPKTKRNFQNKWTHLHADYWEIDGETVENECKKNREKALTEARNNGLITGRPKDSGTKQAMVESFFSDNPTASVRNAAKCLGISPSTVQKWKPQ